MALTVPSDNAVPEPVRRGHVAPGVMLHAGGKGFRNAGGTLEIHGGHAHAVAEDALREVPGGAIPAGRICISPVVDRVEIVTPPLHGNVGAAGCLGARATREGDAAAGPCQGREARALKKATTVEAHRCAHVVPLINAVTFGATYRYVLVLSIVRTAINRNASAYGTSVLLALRSQRQSCLGVYLSVVQPGTLSIGDSLHWP